MSSKMSLERIIIKEKRTKNEIARDRTFYSLVQVMIKDYFRIQKEYEGYIPYRVGKEFTTHLHGALILLEPSDKDVKDYCRKIDYFEPIDLNDKKLVEKLESNLEGDGARAIKNNRLSFKASVYAHHKAEKKEGMEITELIKKYITPSVRTIGERETAALAFSIAAGKHTYTMSQSIQLTQKERVIEEKKYSKVGTGKVAEFGPKGLIRIVKLEDGDEGVPAEHFLDKDVYIKQYNYGFNNSIYLSSENYLTPKDLTLLSDAGVSAKIIEDS